MSSEWLAVLAEAALKAALCLVLAGLVSLLLARHSAAQRHLVWASAIMSVLALPVLQLVLPGWKVPVDRDWLPLRVNERQERSALPFAPPQTVVSPARSETGTAPLTAPAGSGISASASAPSAGRSWSTPPVLLLLWSAGALLALAPLAIASLRVARIVQRATPLDAPRWSALADRAAEAQGLDRSRLDLRRATGPTTPLTWGVLRPVVILPVSCETWSDAQAYEVLVHEAGHMRRHDCLTQLLASAACVFYWFNPLVWLAARRMLTERERACDDQVLLAGARASDYANDLLELARSFGAPWSTAHVTTAMARRSQIAGRLLAVLDPHLDRGGIGRRSVLLGTALTLLVLLPLASATPAGSTPATAGLAGTAPGASSLATAVASRRRVRPSDLEAIARALREREGEYAAALARHDLDALAGLYTADAQIAAPYIPTAHGREGVRGILQRLVDADITRVSVDTRELYPVGELVCQVGSVHLAHESGVPVTVDRFMTLWKNEDGAWRIHREWASR